MKKRVIALVLTFALLLSLAACTGKNDSNNNNNNANVVNDTEIQKEFEAFVTEQYKHAIEDDYATSHVYYLDPAAAGFNTDNIEISFGTVSNEEEVKESREYYSELKKKLESFDREKLTRRQQDEYDSIAWEVASVLAMSDEKFDYYSQYFAPPNSLEANVVGLLSTWEIRNEKDAKDFPVFLDTLPAYVESALEYAKKQQEKKLFMTDYDQVVEGCQDILDAGLDSFVVNRLLGQVDDIEGLDAAKKDELKAEIKASFERSYLPAIKNVKETIDSMRDGYNNEQGLATFPNGAEYFEALLNYKLGYSGLSGQDFKDKIDQRQSAMMKEIMTLYSKNTEEVDNYYKKEHTSGYKDYEGILESVKTKMLEDHPEVKNLEYAIKKADVEEKLEEKNVAAYFVIPPLDGDHKQQMRVNPNNEDFESIDTFMTVAHEGFPGHMYQYAYLYNMDISDYLKTIGVDGQVEGYAVYSQYGALNYLDTISSVEAKVAQFDNRFSYLLYAYMDIGINYDGWSLDDTYKYLNDNGYGVDMDTTKEIYNFLRFSPGTYEPYGLGYEFIAELREKAEMQLKDKFNASEFNKALLEAAPSPCSVVTRYIEEYIESAK